jgi:hypothetical protein
MVELFLLTIYRKSQQEDLNQKQRLRLRALLEVLKDDIKQRRKE